MIPSMVVSPVRMSEEVTMLLLEVISNVVDEPRKVSSCWEG